MANPNPPLNTGVDVGGKLSAPWQQWFNQLYSFLRNIVDFTAANFQVPATGFTIAMGPLDQVLMLKPAGVLATGTVVLPSAPYNGQSVTVSTTNTVTALTLSPSGSETVKNAPTTLVAGAGFRYFYNSSDTTWYRLS